jgi:hypothetical protein
MKNIAFALLFITALATVLHADSQHVLHASFPDGTGLEIFTETTGSSPIDPGGEMGIGPGVGSQDLVHRMVLDRADNILFAYNLEASKGASPDTVKVRIAPLSAATEVDILKDAGRPGHPHFSGSHLPTVAGVREFPTVKMGEAVTLDILYNPSTGEKIYDVLRPITSSSPVMEVSSQATPETIALKDIAIRVNGHVKSAPASFIIGSVVRVDIPRLGTFVVAANDPHEASVGHDFAAIAHADGKTLSWTMGHDRVEITSSMNVLTRSGKGVLWVYHDPHYRPDVVGLQAADTVDWLLPKR